MYDFIIIGSGYGGLSSAALLAERGKEVLILESHGKIAGCASYYKVKDFLFDAGATTLSGIQPNQPLGRLFNQLDIQPKIEKIDPGLIVHINDILIRKHADKTKWIEYAADIFKSDRQKNFWNDVFETEKLAWEFVGMNGKLPPRTAGDFMSLAKPANFKFLPLLPSIFTPVAKVVDKYKLNDELFIKFLTEQLLITTQNTIEDSPFLTAAMGLAYPAETYYPSGGMYKPAELIRQKFESNEGEILFKQKVVSLTKQNNHYIIRTAKGDEFMSKEVISNIPVWNMGDITFGKMKNYFNRLGHYFDSAWGAFTLNFAIEDKGELESLFYQIHSDEPAPYCSSPSFFVSFSHKDDREKAPAGWRTVTVSVHTDVGQWDKGDKEKYSRMKEETTRFILNRFDEVFPIFESAEKLYVLSGSPETFEYYTNRHKGFVGGIPHSVKKSLLKMPPNVTPFKGLYMVGDTVFPGQGTPAVVLGALNTVNRILNK